MARSVSLWQGQVCAPFVERLPRTAHDVHMYGAWLQYTVVLHDVDRGALAVIWWLLPRNYYKTCTTSISL